jgi:antagonist of KipI
VTVGLAAGALRVAHPGALVTVQDRGRPGRQGEGVPAGGAMDEVALRAANPLVGNAEGDAALEIALLGPTLAFDAPALVAVAGADLGAEVDGRALPPWRAARLPRGATLRFRGARAGCHAYLAIAGGVDVPAVLGGRGTLLRAALGGVEGRALRRGDALRWGAPSALAARLAARLAASLGDGDAVAVAPWGAGPSVRPAYAPPHRVASVRLIAGAHADALAPAARDALFGGGEFRVSPQSDRMGYRLDGPHGADGGLPPLALAAPLELLSEGVAFGTVQLPPGGAPIVLMADRQTTGGYPRVGEVATVDLPVVAQLRPGDALRFRAVDVGEAQALYLARERDLAQLARAVALRARGGG